MEIKIEDEINTGSFFDEDYFKDEIKSNYGSYLEYPMFKDFAEYIYKKYSPRSILDVGCAKGFCVKWWRKFGLNAFGIDISNYAVSAAPEEVKKYVLKGDIRNINFPDNYFDIVVSLETIEHILDKDLSKAISELYRVTKRICIISTPFEKSKDDKDLSHVSIHNKDFWVEKFKSVGFHIAFVGDLTFGKWRIRNVLVMWK